MPKAFVELGGVPLFERAVDGLLRASGVIDAVVVAVPPNGRHREADLLLGRGAGRGRWRRPYRQRARAMSAAPDAGFVLVHDAARALTPPELVARVVAEALRAGAAAVVPALPLADTVKAVDANGGVLGTPERARRCGPCRRRRGSRPTCCVRAYASRRRTASSSPTMRRWWRHIGGQVQVVDGRPAWHSRSPPRST